ncbi:unnamed protein product, partial [Iphiclides podalirius]
MKSTAIRANLAAGQSVKVRDLAHRFVYAPASRRKSERKTRAGTEMESEGGFVNKQTDIIAPLRRDGASKSSLTPSTSPNNTCLTSAESPKSCLQLEIPLKILPMFEAINE